MTITRADLTPVDVINHVFAPSPPTATTKDLDDRDEQIEKQRKHLRDIEQWASRLKGPCEACCWYRDGSCGNPVVARAVPDPVSGAIRWDAPRCRDERLEEYPFYNSWGTASDERWRGNTLCGPEGLLFEPRTVKQRVKRGVLRSLFLVPVLLIGHCTYLQFTPHHLICTEYWAGHDGRCWTADDPTK